MGRPVVRFEIGCRDKTKTAEFYGSLFDWTTQEMGPASIIATGAESGIQGHISSLGHEPYNDTIF
jgi:predicted enzyme related to lactoylglutathione lyase